MVRPASALLSFAFSRCVSYLGSRGSSYRPCAQPYLTTSCSANCAPPTDGHCSHHEDARHGTHSAHLCRAHGLHLRHCRAWRDQVAYTDDTQPAHQTPVRNALVHRVCAARRTDIRPRGRAARPAGHWMGSRSIGAVGHAQVRDTDSCHSRSRGCTGVRALQCPQGTARRTLDGGDDVVGRNAPVAHESHGVQG